MPDLPLTLMIGCCPADHCPRLWWDLAQQDSKKRIPVADSVWPNHDRLGTESTQDRDEMNALFKHLPRMFWRQVNTRIRRQLCWQSKEVPSDRLKLGQQKVADQEREKMKRQAQYQKWGNNGPSLTWLPYQLPPEMDPTFLVSAGQRDYVPLTALQEEELMERLMTYYFTQTIVPGARTNVFPFSKSEETLGKEFDDLPVTWRGYPVVPLIPRVDNVKYEDAQTWQWMAKEQSKGTAPRTVFDVYA